MAGQGTNFDQQRLEVPLIENGNRRHHLSTQASLLTLVTGFSGHAQQIVRRAVQRFCDLHQRLQVRITKPGDVVAVSALADAGAAGSLGVADAQFLGPRPQLFRQYVHGNKMFRAAPRVYASIVVIATTMRGSLLNGGVL